MPTVSQRKTSLNIFDVRNYGAKGDYNVTGNSGTDDYAAIQAAITAAQYTGGATNGKCGVVYIPAGHYRVTQELTASDAVIIRGEGRRSSHIWQTTSGNDVINIDGGASDIDGPEITGLRLSCRVAEAAGSAALRLEKCVRPILRDLWLTGGAVGLQLGLDSNDSGTLVQDLYADSVHCQENTIGCRVGSCNQSHFSGCWFNQNTGDQLVIDNASACHVSGGLIQGGGSYGVKAEPYANGSINGLTIEGCHIEVTGASSVASILIGASAKYATGVSIANNWFSSTNVDYGIQSVACYNLDIRANRFLPGGSYESVNLANTTGTISGLDPTVDSQTIASSCRIHWADVFRAVATGSRPTMYDVPIGHMIFDTTLGLPIWWNGSVWKDAAGVTR